jgi:hypothetical protein
LGESFRSFSTLGCVSDNKSSKCFDEYLFGILAGVCKHVADVVTTVVRDGKRLKGLDDGGVSGRTPLCEADRLQRSSEVRPILFTNEHILSISYCL